MPVLTDIVCSHRRKGGACRQGRAPLHTGVLKTYKRVKHFKDLKSLNCFLQFDSSYLQSLNCMKCYSPVGNCEEANLVSRIPAPSINAKRIPPMAAEPTMATGPSAIDQPKSMLCIQLYQQIRQLQRMCSKSVLNIWETVKSRHECFTFYGSWKHSNSCERVLATQATKSMPISIYSRAHLLTLFNN